MKRYAFLMIPVFCVFVLSCGENNSNGLSKPGEYTGYGDAIYDDEYEITSQYVQVSDGTQLAMAASSSMYLCLLSLKAIIVELGC